MLARGYITDNSQFPDAEFQQIVGGMRRLKPACDEHTTVSAVNNMPSMQEIDEAVLQLVKDCGKKLAHTIKPTKKVPPGSGVPPGKSLCTRCYYGSTLQLSVSGVLQQRYRTVAQLSKMLQAQPKTHLLPWRIPNFLNLTRILHPRRFPKLSSFLTLLRRIFLRKSNRLFQCLFLVRRWGSTMVRRYPKPRTIPVPRISNRRTILNWQRIIRRKSNRLSQCLSRVRRCGSKILPRRIFKPMTWHG